MTSEFLKVWHQAISKKDLSLMDHWVSDDVILESPALYHPKVGKKEVSAILKDVLASFETYTVTKTWVDQNEVLLEFDAKVKGLSLQGIDKITLNSEGKLIKLKVFIRPFKGLQALIMSVVEFQIERLNGMKKLWAKTIFKLKIRKT